LAKSGNNWDNGEDKYVPLYEAKMIHQFDHRWATYEGLETRDVTTREKQDPAYEPKPRYWVPYKEASDRLARERWTREWMIGWRDICRSTDERAVIASIFPKVGSGDSLLLMFPGAEPQLIACMLANLCSLPLDYCARQKVGGTHLKLN